MAHGSDRVVPFLLCLAAGLLAAAPWLDFSFYPTAWLAFTPFAMAVWSAPTAKIAFRRGLLVGMCGLVPAFWWLIYTMEVFGGFPWIVAAFFYLCLSLYSACEFAIFAWILRRLGPGPIGLAAPVAWVAVEWVFPNLFPWRMGHSQLEWTSMLQIGDVTGPYGLSFVVVWFGAGVALYLRERSFAPLVAAVLAAVAVFGYGQVRSPQIEAAIASSPRTRIGLVQGNVGIVEKSNSAYFDINVEKYRELSRSLQSDVDVVIWPETVSHDWISQRSTRLSRAEHPFPELSIHLIFGGLGYDYRAGEEALRFNTAFLIDSEARVVDRYNKQILLPFGEFLPFSSWIPYLKEISPNSGDFTAGEISKTLDVPGGPRFAPLVCYEDVPSRIARDMTGRGAEVLFTIFNDAWFGVSMAPYQHEAIATWRAIENRRFFVRIGNAGDTGVIDPLGRIVDRLDLFVAATLVADVARLEVETFYTRYGDVFGWTMFAAATAWWILARRRSDT